MPPSGQVRMGMGPNPYSYFIFETGFGIMRTGPRPHTFPSGYLPGQPQPLGEIGGLGNRPYGAPLPSDLPRRIMRTGLLPHTFPRSTSPRGWGNSVHAKSHRGYSAKRTGKNGNGSKSRFLFYIRNRFRNNENGSASTHVP